MADIPAIRITAVDQASAVISQVGRSLDGLRSAAAGLQSVMGALGVGFSAGAIIAYGKSVVETAENLKHLADETGSSVESLSRLSNISKISGTNFDTFRLMLERMTVGLAGIDEGGSKAAKALEYLGVTAKDPATALQEVADKLAQYADDASKAAIARDLFGRGGAQFVSTLKQMADAHGVAATMTKQQAEEAEQLAINVRTLEVNMTSLKNAVLSDVVPALNNWIEGVKAARKEGLGWLDSFITGTTYADRLTPSIAAMSEKIRQLQHDMENARKQNTPWFLPGMQEELDTATKKLNVLLQMRNSAIMQNVAGMGYTGDVRDYLANKKPALGYTGSGDAKTVKELTDVYARLAEEIARAGLALNGLTEIEKIELAISKNLADVNQKRLTPAQQEMLRFEAARVDWEKELADTQKTLYEQEMERLKTEAELELQQDRMVTAAEKIVENLEFEATALQMTNAEREKAIALRNLEAAGIDKTNEKYGEYVDRINNAVEKKEALQGQINLWKGIEDAAHNAFMHIFETGKSVWERLTDSLKSTLLELLYQITVKQWIINISASLGLTGANSALANTGNIGGLFSTGGSLFGGAGNFLANILPPELGGGSLFGGTGALEGLASIGGGLPLIGIGFGLAALISNLFSKGGGPKTGGYYATGATPGIYGTDSSGRWMTPSDQDAAIKTMLEGAQKNYQDFAKALGVNMKDVVFAMGMSMDPRGTAPSNVHSGLWVGGKQVYNMEQPNLPRDEAAVQAAMTLEVERMLIVALQNSDLPGKLGQVFSKIDVKGLDQTAAENLLTFAQAYKNLYDVFNANPLDDAMQALADAAEGAQGALEKQGKALQDLLDTYDGTASSTTALVSATQEYYKNVVAFLAYLEQTKQKIADMFQGSIKTYKFAGLDTQGQYKYLQDEAARYQKELLTATSADRVQKLAELIDADMREAFGLLSPEQQKQLAPEFIKGAEEVNAQATAQLDKVGKAAESQMNTILTAIKTAIDEAADKFAQGGANVQEGGADILNAAHLLTNTPYVPPTGPTLKLGSTLVNG